MALIGRKSTRYYDYTKGGYVYGGPKTPYGGSPNAGAISAANAKLNAGLPTTAQHTAKLNAGLPSAPVVAGGRSTGVGSSSTIAGAFNAANAANEARYAEGKGIYGENITALEGLGESGRTRIERNRVAGIGSMSQGLVNRGLSNTTIRDSLERGINEDAELNTQQLNESVALTKNAARSELAQFIERRTDLGPDLNSYANAIAQAGGYAGTSGHKTAAAKNVGATFKGKTSSGQPNAVQLALQQLMGQTPSVQKRSRYKTNISEASRTANRNKQLALREQRMSEAIARGLISPR